MISINSIDFVIDVILRNDANSKPSIPNAYSNIRIPFSKKVSKNFKQFQCNDSRREIIEPEKFFKSWRACVRDTVKSFAG